MSDAICFFFLIFACRNVFDIVKVFLIHNPTLYFPTKEQCFHRALLTRMRVHDGVLVRFMVSEVFVWAINGAKMPLSTCPHLKQNKVLVFEGQYM